MRTPSEARKTQLKRFAVRAFFMSLIGFAAFGVLLGLGRGLFPQRTFEIQRQWQLRQAGVRAIEFAPGLAGYERNHCEEVAARDCTCALLIHGGGDQALTWKNVLEAPSSKWAAPMRFFAIDLPGAGDSQAPKNADDYRVRTQATRLNAVLRTREECRGKGWLVAGNSFGGWIAAWMALGPETPPSSERALASTGQNTGAEVPPMSPVAKLALIDSSGLKEYRHHPVIEKLALNPTVETLKEFQHLAYYQPREYPDSFWQMALERARKSNTSVVREVQKDEDELDGLLGFVRVPTLVFWGGADRIIPSEAGQTLAARIPGAVLRVTPRCGHMPQKECPDDLIAGLNELIRHGAF